MHKWLLAVLLLFPLTGMAEDKQHFQLGVFAYRPVELMQERFQPLVDYLNEQLEGSQIHLQILDLPELTQAVEEGRLDLVLTNPSHYNLLRHHYALQGPLVTLVNLEQGIPTRALGGVILVDPAAGISELSQLRHQRVAVPGTYFLGGYQTQVYELMQLDIHPQQDFEVEELGSHDAVITALLQGKYVAGFVRTGVLESKLRQGELKPGQLQVLNPQQYAGFPFQVSTRLYPEWPLASIGECVCTRELVRALLNLAPDHPAVLALGIDGFSPPADYSVMDRLAFALKLPPYNQSKPVSLLDLWRDQPLLILIVGSLLIFTLGFLLALMLFNRRLRLANDHFTQLYQHLPLPVILLDPATDRFVDCNAAGLKLLKLNNTTQIIGRKPEDISPEYQPDGSVSSKARKTHFEALKETETLSFEWMHLASDGLSLLVQVTLIPVEIHGQPLILGVWYDLTERQRSELAVQESELRFRQFAENTDLVFWVRTADEMLYINPAYERIWGRSCNDLYVDPYSFAQAIHPQDRERVFAAFDAEMKQTGLFDQRYRILRPDGEVRWIHARSYPILDDQGVLIRTAGIASDITDQVQLNEALQQKTESLQKSNAELEQFAYVVSHDLRQPLRMIGSYLQLLERRLETTLTDETREMMHFAVDGASRLDQMLVSLLEYSRVGRKGLPMTNTLAETAIQEALQFLQPLIDEKQARVQLLTKSWPMLHASPDELTRLFQNLIGNALKYHKPGQAPQVSLDVERTKGHWRFCIRDQGIGIAPEQFDRLFRVFQRLHTRSEYEGTGIGLAVCRKIVERHGGRIWVESEGEGKGCRFCFVLPFADSREA